MYPTLFYIGNFAVKTHYILNLIGIAAGFTLLLYTTSGFNNHKIKRTFAFAVFIFIPFIIGGRLGSDLERILSGMPPCHSNLFFIGTVSLLWGMALSVIFAFPVSKITGTNLWEIGDCFAVSISIGGFFVRLGCFFHGCCFGLPAHNKFLSGYSFAPGSPAYYTFPETKLYPTQLYEAFCWLAIFLVLFLRYKRKAFHGEIIIFMSILYSACRFIIEFFRYHYSQTTEIIGKLWPVVIFVTAVTLYFIITKHLLKTKRNVFRTSKT